MSDYGSNAQSLSFQKTYLVIHNSINNVCKTDAYIRNAYQVHII